MAITNYGELKAKVRSVLKRRDFDAEIPDFIQSAHRKLCDAVGPVGDLQDDTDTNPLLFQYPDHYVNGACAEGFIFARDLEMANVYQAKFQADLQNLYAAGGYDHLVQTLVNNAPVKQTPQ